MGQLSFASVAPSAYRKDGFESPIGDPFRNRQQNNGVGDLNKPPVQYFSTQRDGFLDQCRPSYDLNSLPRPALDAPSYWITGSLPFTPVTPGTQRKVIHESLINDPLENQPVDKFLVPCRPCYNLNSSPTSEPDADLPFAPVTPEGQQQNSHENLRHEYGDNPSIRDSTSSVVSTKQKEHLVSEEGDRLGIDLNKTPNQKTPAKRKKHRPKVIREGKPKKTQMPKDPDRVKRKFVRKTPQETVVEESPNDKRKYVMKKVVDQSECQQKGREVDATKPATETPTKSCRKQLIFDLECVASDERQNRETQVINLEKNLEDVEQERIKKSVLERPAMNVAQNSMYAGVTTHQESSRMRIESELKGSPTSTNEARDHELNVLARNLNMRNKYNQVGPMFTDLEEEELIGQTVNVDVRKDLKRPCLEQINSCNKNASDFLSLYEKVLLGGDNRVDCSHDSTRIMESHKRTKMQSDLYIPCHEDNSSGELRLPVYDNMSAMQLLNSCLREVNSLPYQVNKMHFQPPIAATENLQKHPGSSGMQTITERSQRSTQGRVNLITAMVSWNQMAATPPKDHSRSPVVTTPATLLDKKRTVTQYAPSQRSNGTDTTPLTLCKDASGVHQITFPNPKGRPSKQKDLVSVEVITRMLEDLCIYEENRKDSTVLVPYRGDNAIIPFEPIKKRKPRPKVDLDPETDRTWRLLMGNEESEAAEATDKDKEKWWEKERHVFCGRAESFIARMHLVQGDRRFSRWKGSVVDSVIGVFLTQNVSDHLSSSAFMSLASKFTPKTRSTNEAHCQAGTCVLVEDALETILPTAKIGKQLFVNQRPFVSSKIQTNDEFRSSASNSEAGDQMIGFKISNEPSPGNHRQAKKVTTFKELFSQTTWTPPHQFRMNMATGVQNAGARDFSRYRATNVTYSQKVPPQGHQYKPDNIAQKDPCGGGAGPEAGSKEPNYGSHSLLNGQYKDTSKSRKGTSEDEKKKASDWDSLRREVLLKCGKKERSKDAKDSIDYEALRRAHVNEISDAIRERGMNNMLAARIKDFLDRLVRDHGSIDLEWLRDVPPDKAKDYLLSIRGLGLKSVECVRLLTLHHLAFPVDTNVGRIAVRLGWVPLQPLPESLQLHLLEMYPMLASIQKYLWPRLCKLDQLTLYELHYQMITFGKVFCTKSRPNCNACPMRAECRHFASAFASARLALPGPEEKRIVPSDAPCSTNAIFTAHNMISGPMKLPLTENNCNKSAQLSCEPIIEEPTTPEPEPAELSPSDIEDQYYGDEDTDEIPLIKLDMKEFTANLQRVQDSMEIKGDVDMSKALVALTPQAASIPTPKLKNVGRLRTEHLVYELPDSHPLLVGLYKREPDDPSPYLLAIWTPGETAHSTQPPERGCEAQESGMLCDRTTCFSCNCFREANSQVVRGTILMPCRTATQGSFPLNGTYFQVNEMFADHASSLNPIDVPRKWIWNLPRRTVYFGTSVSTIFRGLTTQETQQCFWRGFVCVRGFDQKTRSPRPLMARLHFPASKIVKTKTKNNQTKPTAEKG